MKAQEKLQIYDLLKTISTFINGYVPNTFSSATPNFTDDIENSAKEEFIEKSNTNCNTEFDINNFGHGVNNPHVLVICHNPDMQLLEKMLSAINLFNNKNCFIANEKILNSAEVFSKSINFLQPQIILSMGENITATLVKLTLQNQYLFDSVRGHFLPFENFQITATYDTQSLLQNNSLKALAWEDLKKVKLMLLQVAPTYQN